MATENKPTPDEASYVVQRGTKTDLGGGKTRHVGRHPQNPDHKITIVTATVNNKPQIIQSTREHAPLQAIVQESKAREQAKQERVTRSKAARAEQLAKKRARTPKPKNKK